MNFTASREVLRQALQHIQGLVGTSRAYPLSECVRFTVEADGRCKIEWMDKSLSMQGIVRLSGFEVEEPGTAIFPLAPLMTLIKVAQATDDIQLRKVKNQNIDARTVGASGLRHSVWKEYRGDWRNFEIPKGAVVCLPGKLLAELIQRGSVGTTKHAGTTADVVRIHHAAVTKTCAVETVNGYYLVRALATVPGDAEGEDMDVLISRPHALLLKALANRSSEVTLILSHFRLVAFTDQETLLFSIHDFKMPDFQSLLARQTPPAHPLAADPVELTKFLRSFGGVTQFEGNEAVKGGNEIILRAGEGQLFCHSQNQHGQANGVLDLPGAIHEQYAAYNLNYWLAVLRGTAGIETISFAFHENEKMPAWVVGNSATGVNFHALVMSRYSPYAKKIIEGMKDAQREQEGGRRQTDIQRDDAGADGAGLNQTTSKLAA